MVNKQFFFFLLPGSVALGQVICLFFFFSCTLKGHSCRRDQIWPMITSTIAKQLEAHTFQVLHQGVLPGNVYRFVLGTSLCPHNESKHCRQAQGQRTRTCGAIFVCGKIHSVTILTIFKCTAQWYYTVQSSPASTSRALFMLLNWNSIPIKW